jgi:hypothetical protein
VATSDSTAALPDSASKLHLFRCSSVFLVGSPESADAGIPGAAPVATMHRIQGCRFCDAHSWPFTSVLRTSDMSTRGDDANTRRSIPSSWTETEPPSSLSPPVPLALHGFAGEMDQLSTVSKRRASARVAFYLLRSRLWGNIHGEETCGPSCRGKTRRGGPGQAFWTQAVPDDLRLFALRSTRYLSLENR